jgi:fibronectin-binding autotransporter adhesin
MGNVIQGINQDGSNSGTFSGNYTNLGSTTTNFTGTNVNFTGTGQRVVFGSTGSTGTITYWNAPSFMTGASFPDGTRVTFNNNSFLDSTGKINSSFIPSTTSSSTVNTIQLNQSLSGTGSINLSQGSITGATGYFQTLNSNNSTEVLKLFPSHTGNIEIGNTNSSSYIYFRNNLYSGNSSKGINAGYYNGYSSNGNVSLGGSTNQGNVNVGKDLTSGNVNVGNSSASGTGTINLYQNVVAAKNLTLNSTTGTISAPTFTGANYVVTTSMTGPGAINTTGNITTSGTISGAFTGSNYYLGTSMTGPGSINVTGGITGANLYATTGFFQTLNSNNSTEVLKLFPSHTGNIEIGNTNSSNYISFNNNLYAGDNTKGINASYYNGYSAGSNVSLGGITTRGNVNVGSAVTSGNVNVGNSSASGTGTINLYQNVVAAKNLNVTGDIQGKKVKIQENNITFTDNNDKGLIYTSSNNTNWDGTNTPAFKPSDGMVLYGWTDGALGTKSGGDKTSLYWDKDGNVNVRGAFKVNSSKVSTSAPVGGLRVQGTNQWIIGENSTGNLCFYQGTSSVTPLACITTAGNLVAGTG